MRLILIMLISSTLFAEEMTSFTQLMSSSKKQTIDGKEYTCKPVVPADPNKKKKIAKKKKPEPPKEIIVTKEVIKEVEVVKEVDLSYKNQVKLYVGIAPGYTNSVRVGDVVTLENKLGFVPGIGYQRQLDKLWSLEGIILFNKSVIVGVGRSF
jgi:hypothetical protein